MIGSLVFLRPYERINIFTEDPCDYVEFLLNNYFIVPEQFEEKPLQEIYTDSELLHQVFVAIISNSNKFIKQNPLIELKCTQTENQTTIGILDNGPGFEENVLPHVFERFYRGDSSHNRSAGGSGLGLSIAQAIIKSLNGKIIASNGKNGGALITIILKNFT